MAHPSFREEELSIKINWFIQLRWIFILGLFVTVFLATQVLKIQLPVTKILVVGVVVSVYNAALFLFHRYYSGWSADNLKRIRGEANVQIVLDLLGLTLLIHFSGGVENPFIVFYLFHAIIASILLSRVEVWVHGCLTYALFITIVALEYFGVLPHYRVDNFFAPGIHQNLYYIFAVCFAFMVALFTTIYMSSTIMKGLRGREKQLYVTLNILEKQSEDLKKTNLEKHRQLVQSEKLSSLGQLVSGCAHEINNPVQFILGNMRIFAEAFSDVLPILDEHVKENPQFQIARLKYDFFKEYIRVLLDDMSTGAMRIRDIVADLKTFARADEGRLDEEVDINDVVQVCSRLVHTKIKHFKVEEDLETKLPKVLGSSNKLQQVVMATLINAAEALSNRADGKIIITTRNEDGGRGVRISISDNGPGITEEVKKKMFDPFFTTKQRCGGTGLGLSISYGIIEEHGGRINVESEPEKGATFFYHIPVDRSKTSNGIGKIFQSRLEFTFGKACGGAITYAFDDNNESMSCHVNTEIPLGDPTAISMWIRGDGSLHQLNMAYRDSKKELRTACFSKNALQNLSWHVVTAHIPDDAKPPLKLESIFISQNAGDLAHLNGHIDLDDLSAHYDPE